ncbi:hypothetical protein GW750_02370 [bacterium]|nr:hypothetical protein [bacterium]
MSAHVNVHALWTVAHSVRFLCLLIISIFQRSLGLIGIVSVSITGPKRVERTLHVFVMTVFARLSSSNTSNCTVPVIVCPGASVQRFRMISCVPSGLYNTSFRGGIDDVPLSQYGISSINTVLYANHVDVFVTTS